MQYSRFQIIFRLGSFDFRPVRKCNRNVEGFAFADWLGRCFRDGRPPCPYIQQKRAWMDRTAYRFFFFYVFLPCIRQTTTDKVALLMDNCAGHDSTIVDPTWQVRFFFPSKLYTSSPATRSRHHFIFQDFVKDGSRDGTHRILHKSQCKRS